MHCVEKNNLNVSPCSHFHCRWRSSWTSCKSFMVHHTTATNDAKSTSQSQGCSYHASWIVVPTFIFPCREWKPIKCTSYRTRDVLNCAAHGTLGEWKRRRGKAQMGFGQSCSIHRLMNEKCYIGYGARAGAKHWELHGVVWYFWRYRIYTTNIGWDEDACTSWFYTKQLVKWPGMNMKNKLKPVIFQGEEVRYYFTISALEQMLSKIRLGIFMLLTGKGAPCPIN